MCYVFLISYWRQYIWIHICNRIMIVLQKKPIGDWWDDQIICLFLTKQDAETAYSTIVFSRVYSLRKGHQSLDLNEFVCNLKARLFFVCPSSIYWFWLPPFSLFKLFMDFLNRQINEIDCFAKCFILSR